MIDAPAPSDPEPETVVLRAGPATYTDEGAGPVLVALHGLPGAARDFRYLAGALAGRVRLLRIDLPGFGGTPLHTMPGTHVRERGVFVLAVLDALRVDRFAVLGHSMGGPVAIHVAARAPDRVRALALLASPGLRPHVAVRRAPWLGAISAITSRSLGRAALGPAVRATLARLGLDRGHSDDALVHALRVAASLRFDVVRDDVNSIAAPSLVAWARDDHMVEDAIGNELAAALPPGPRLVFEHGGHAIQKTRARDLADALASFIA